MTKQTFFIKRSIAIYTVILIIFISGKGFSQTLDPDPPLAIAMAHLTNGQSYPTKTSYPRTTNADGSIKRVNASDWTSGFFPGSLWLMYEYTKDDIWKTRAQQWTAGLEGQKNNTSTHDVGFILYSSLGAGYRLTQNGTYNSIILQGARSLSTRFNPVVGCIKSWDNNPNYIFPVIIDNMMNLEMLFWATKVSGDSSFYRIAVQHALKTMANHFRPDNSSYHVVDYNPTTGAIISKTTSQGLNNLSDWARGQAWGLYGFTMTYRETGDAQFLDMAKKIADFIMLHPNMPSDLVPFWDFDAFDYRDASAAAISASAFLELSEYVPNRRTQYYNFGISVLNKLSSVAYSAPVGTNNNFVLQHGVGNKPKNTEVDKPLIYADYYYIQALLRHKKPAPIVSSMSGANDVTLNWNKATGASNYHIKRSLIRGGPYTIIASNVTATTYKDQGLVGGTTYYYVITSTNAMGEGQPSIEVNGTPTAAPATYRITTSANGSGTISKSPDQNEYAANAAVTLTAIPSAGQQFIGWSGDVSGMANPLTIIMTGDKNITANFAVIPQQYNLNIKIKGSGSVTRNPDQVSYASGSSVTLTAIPSAGQQFTGWSGNASGTSNPLTIVINGNTNITSNFASLPALVSNITNTSGRFYLLDELIVGKKIYTDRAYVATSVPSFLNNAPFIRTPNDDKAKTSTSILSFNLNQAATLYIAYDPRATRTPSWMSTWKKVTGQTIGINDPDISYLLLYSRSFPAGPVTLGGNMASPAKGARSNYIVVAVPQQSITTQSIASMTYNIQNSVRIGTDVVQEAETRHVLRSFRIYPNPNQGKEFFLEAKDFSNSELVTITIYDVSGKILQSTLTRADLNGSLNKLVSISPKLSRGVFFIRVASRWRYFQHRLVVD